MLKGYQSNTNNIQKSSSLTQLDKQENKLGKNSDGGRKAPNL